MCTLFMLLMVFFQLNTEHIGGCLLKAVDCYVEEQLTQLSAKQHILLWLSSASSLNRLMVNNA